MTKIEAPFTDDQVIWLNRYQRSGGFHPFTCGKRDDHVGRDVLIATPEGWHCPTCDYIQEWAHPWMADPATVEALEALGPFPKSPG